MDDEPAARSEPELEFLSVAYASVGGEALIDGIDPRPGVLRVDVTLHDGRRVSKDVAPEDALALELAVGQIVPVRFA